MLICIIVIYSGSEVALARVGAPDILTLPNASSLDSLVDILRQLGCQFLSREYNLPINTLCGNGLVHAFALKGILTVLGRMPAEQLTRVSSQLPRVGADALREYAVSKCGELLYEPNFTIMSTALKSLCIYPLHASSSLSTLWAPVPLIAPTDLNDKMLLSMRPFLNVASEEESVFYKNMGLRRTDALMCVREVFMPALHQHTQLDLAYVVTSFFFCVCICVCMCV